MAQEPLSPADLQRAADALIQTNGNVCKAADLVGKSRQTFAHHAHKAQQAGLVDLDKLREKPAAPATRLPVTADECWEVIHQFIGQKRMPPPKPPKWKPGKTQRIVVAGDFHAPFHDVSAVSSLVANESKNCDLLVISGDLLDLYSVSRFTKSEPITIQQEWAGGTALLAQLAAAFPDILMIHGNHDERVERQLRTKLEPELAHAIEILTGGDFSLIRLLAKAHGNVRVADHQSGRFSMPWLCQVGDLVVSHAEKFSRVPGSTLRQVEEGLADFERVYGLDGWRVLVQAHTHAFGMFPWRSDRLLVEGGCMCQDHGYQMGARMGGRPQRRGYVTLTQHDGKTDLNSVKFRWLDVEERVA